MTRRRSSPLGLELVLSTLLACMLLPLLTQAAPLQDITEIQQYTEGCYYNYNHYNEGDRILTNEPCLNCTCHNKMLMCYLRVCPFTKPIGHDCIVEKREDQCCPIITCPEVPVDIAHHTEPGTELSIPEKYGCSIDERFYPEGAQVPSNPNKPCELCYCIKNRTSCLMQECTLHIDGCQPIYNKGSCCPVRYNCDHENDVLELEDHSTSTTTTVRPTQGFLLTTTTSPAVTTDCIHNGEYYADGASLHGKNACEHCYCMRGDIVCAVQECEMPMLAGNGKSCHPLPASEGECCPRNYVCEDDTTTTQIIDATTVPYLGEEVKPTTTVPLKDLHSSVSEEDLQLQTHIDDDGQLSTASPEQTVGHGKPIAADEYGSGDRITEPAEGGELEATTASVQSMAVDKHEHVSSTTAGPPTVQDESNAPTIKTPTADIVESVTTSIENEDAIEATTARIDASETLTEKPEDKMHVDEEKIDSTTADSQTTKLSVTTEKPTYTADDIMDDNVTTEKSEELGEEDIDVIGTTTQHTIDSEEDTTEILDSTEAAEGETEDSKKEVETSSTTVKTEIDVTTIKTEPAKTEVNIVGISQTDILQEPEEGSGEASEEGVDHDFSTEKVQDGSGSQSHKENDIEIVTTYPILEDDNDLATKHPITDGDIATYPKHEDDVEVITKQPNAENDIEVVTTQPAAEVEGSGADAEDVESSSSTLGDEEHTIATLTTQKIPIGADHKENVIDTNAPAMESTTEVAEDESKNKPEIDAVNEISATLGGKETTGTDRIMQETTALPAIDDEQSIIMLTERFDANNISEASTSSSALPADEQDSTTLPSSKQESFTTVSSLDTATTKKETDDAKPSQQTDAIEYTTSSSLSSIDSSSKPSEDQSAPETTAADSELDTSSEHLLDNGLTTNAPEQIAHDIAQTTVQPDSAEDDSSENIFNMPNIPAVIPGEGNCLVGMETYQNNSIIPPSDECEISCKCVSSIVDCQRVQCQAPKNLEKCSLAKANADKCCPTYICETDALPTKHSDEEAQKEITQATIAPSLEDIIPTTTETSEQQHITIPSAKLPLNEVDNKSTDMLPTDIYMPTASTEEPMSHVKDEIAEDDEQHRIESIPEIDEPIPPATEMPVLTQTPTVITEQSPVVKPHEDVDSDDISTPIVEEAIISQTIPTLANNKPANVQDTIDIDASLGYSTTSPRSETTTSPTSEATPVLIADKTPVYPEESLSAKPVTPSSSNEGVTTVSGLNQEHKHPSNIGKPEEDTPTTEASATTDAEEGSGEATEENETSDDSGSESTEGTTAHSNVPAYQTEKVSTDDTLAVTLDQSTEGDDTAEHTISPASQIKNKETIPDITQTISPVIDDIQAPTQTTPIILEKHEEVSTTSAIIESGDNASVITFAPTTGFGEVHTSSSTESTTETIDKIPAVLIEAATSTSDVDEKTETPASSTDEKEREYIDDSEEHILAHTTVPSINKEDIEDTTSHNKSTDKNTTDQPTAQTILSDIEGEKEVPTHAPKHDDVGQDDSFSQAVSPVVTVEAVTDRPADEDKYEETTSAVLSHTFKPAFDAEKDTTPMTEDKLVEHNVESVTDINEHTSASEYEKHDTILSHTTAAPTEGIEEETYESLEGGSEQNSTPSTEHGNEESIDASLAHTTPALESDKETTDNALMATIAPAIEFKKKDKPTQKPATEASVSAVNDNTLAHTDSPSPANEVEDTISTVLDHTIAPATDEDHLTPSSNQIKQKVKEEVHLSHTDEPLPDKSESTDENLSHPISSFIEELTVEPIGDSTEHPAISVDDLMPIITTPIVETEEKTSGDIVAHTTNPLGSVDKPQDTIDKFLSPDISPDAEDQKTPIENDNTLPQSTEPAVEDKNEEEAIDSQTNSPDEAEIEAIDDHFPHIIAPASEDKEEDIDETEASTLSPFNIKKETVEESVAPTSSPVPDDTLEHTLSPVGVEKEFIDRTFESTVSPVGEDSDATDGTLSLADEEKETTDETFSHAASPVEDKKEAIDDSLTPSTSTVGEENETIADTLLTTVGPVSGNKEIFDDELAHTLSPVRVEEDSIDEASTQTSSTAEDEKKTMDDSLTSTSSSVGIKKETIDDTTVPSSTPVNEEEEQTDVTLEHTDTPSTEGIEAVILDDLSQTAAPAIENDDENIAHHVTAPTTEDRTDETMVEVETTISPTIEEQEETTEKFQDIIPGNENTTADETLAHTVSPSNEGTSTDSIDLTNPAVDANQAPVDDALSHTVGPVVKDEESIDSASYTTDSSIDDANNNFVSESSAQTVAPMVEQEKGTTDELMTPIPHTEIIDQATEEVTPVIAAEDKDLVDDILAHTLSPVAENGETVQPVEHTESPIEKDIKKESYDEALSHTNSPATEKHDKPFVDSMEHTYAPILENESESQTVIPSIDDEGQKTIDEPLSQSVYPDVDSVKDIIQSHTTTSPLKETEVQTETIGSSNKTDKEIIHATATTISSLGDGSLESTKRPVIEDHTTKAEEDKIDNRKEMDEAIAHTSPSVADINKDLAAVTTPTPSSGTPVENMSEKTITSLDENTSSTYKPFVSKYDEKFDQKNLDATTAPISNEEITEALDAYTTEEPQDARPQPIGVIGTELPTIIDSNLYTNPPTNKESTTRLPSVIADLEPLEETDESIESEEEMTTDLSAHKIQHIGEFVTDRVEESVTETTSETTQGIKSKEPDSSSQESEEEHVPISDEQASDQTSVKPTKHSSSSTLMPDTLESDLKTESQAPIDAENQVTETSQSKPVVTTIKPETVEGPEDTTTLSQNIFAPETIVGEHTEATALEDDTTKPHYVEAAIESITEGITDAVKTQKVTERTESSEETDVEKEDDSSTSQEDAELSPIANKHPLFPHHTSTTEMPITSAVTHATTVSGVNKLTTTTTAFTTTTTEAPVTTSAPTTHYAPPPPPPGYGQPPQYPAYPEDEYTDEDETEVFGPGTCRYGGKLFVSAQQIPRDDPCDFCFCFRSDIICLQQSCPPPISGCHEEPISGFCCPRYECPVSMATTLNITTSTTTTSTTLPPHFLHHAYDGAAQKTGCHINGKSYRVGEKIDSTSGPCMHCTCGGDGQMKCDPKTCSPEPMLRQMIAVVASRRR